LKGIHETCDASIAPDEIVSSRRAEEDLVLGPIWRRPHRGRPRVFARSAL